MEKIDFESNEMLNFTMSIIDTVEKLAFNTYIVDTNHTFTSVERKRKILRQNILSAFKLHFLEIDDNSSIKFFEEGQIFENLYNKLEKDYHSVLTDIKVSDPSDILQGLNTHIAYALDQWLKLPKQVEEVAEA